MRACHVIGDVFGSLTSNALNSPSFQDGEVNTWNLEPEEWHPASCLHGSHNLSYHCLLTCPTCFWYGFFGSLRVYGWTLSGITIDKQYHKAQRLKTEDSSPFNGVPYVPQASQPHEETPSIQNQASTYMGSRLESVPNTLSRFPFFRRKRMAWIP